MAEHLTRNEKVVGSIPTISSNNSRISDDIRELLHFYAYFSFAVLSRFGVERRLLCFALSA